MSQQIMIMEGTGSRNVPLSITRYYGGKDVGVCYQLTAEMEEGTTGYVQLTPNELMCILSVVRNDVQESVPNNDSAECKHERGSMVTDNGQEWFVCKHCHEKYERYF